VQLVGCTLPMSQALAMHIVISAHHRSAAMSAANACRWLTLEAVCRDKAAAPVKGPATAGSNQRTTRSRAAAAAHL